jgi:hypothetical protein
VRRSSVPDVLIGALPILIRYGHASPSRKEAGTLVPLQWCLGSSPLHSSCGRHQRGQAPKRAARRAPPHSCWQASPEVHVAKQASPHAHWRASSVACQQARRGRLCGWRRGAHGTARPMEKVWLMWPCGEKKKDDGCPADGYYSHLTPESTQLLV